MAESPGEQEGKAPFRFPKWWLDGKLGRPEQLRELVNDLIDGRIALLDERDSLRSQLVEAREALESVVAYIKADMPGEHHRMGNACGTDACVLCLAEGTATQALARLSSPTEER